MSYAIHICMAPPARTVVLDDKTYRFEFHDYTGPVFLDARGNPLPPPGTQSRCWDAFEVWFAIYHSLGKMAGKKCHPLCNVCSGHVPRMFRKGRRHEGRGFAVIE